MSTTLTLPSGKGINYLRNLRDFSIELVKISNTIGFKISARGWCYQLESFRLINKDQFDLVQRLINKARETGLLPIDFVAEEESRKFSGIEIPESQTIPEYLKSFIEAVIECEKYYTPDWWEGEQYYIQMLVEKIDLKTLFDPVCREYHIPIATSKGWSSMLQRAEYAKRYKQAEEKGMKCVLLYCGDHDPDGLRISDFIRSNLQDLMYIRWNDGTKGYDPTNLIIDRFGLNYDFIEANHLTWIDNLITGSGKNLADENHRNHWQEYVQEYIQKIGIRKCEANAIVPHPQESRQLCRNAIEHYIGADAIQRFQQKREAIFKKFDELREKTGVQEALETALETLENED